MEISFIRPKNQRYIAVSIEGQQSSPSVSQAQKMRELDKDGKPMIYVLVSICALLLVCLISYMVWDAQLATAGLFHSAGSSALVVVLGLIVVAAVCVMVYALRMLKK